MELARLRETYIQDQNSRDATIQQQKLVLENQQRENIALREILAARGISFENELENRKAVISMRPKREDNSMTPPSMMSTMSPPSVAARSAGFGTVVPGPPSATTGFSPQGYLNGAALSVSGHSPAATHHSHSPPGPEIQEFAVKQEPAAVPDMPGIFEREPQLGIDFILQ